MTPRRCIDCGEVIERGSRCPVCAWRAKAARSPERMRGRAWMKRRAAVLRRAGGVCERCGDRLANEVHHMGELSDNRMESLVALCAPCHSHIEVEKQAKGTR